MFRSEPLMCALAALALAACEQAPRPAAPTPPAPFNPEIAHRDSKVETLPVYEDAAFTPRWIDAEALDSTEVHTIPDFSFTNQLGEAVTQETFEDKITIVDFFFTTCPGICKDMTINMKGLQTEFSMDPDVLFLSHTVTPDIDTPETLAAYGEVHGIVPNKWHLVTGDRATIYDLGRRHYFIEEDMGVAKSDDEFLHTENFLVIDGKRRIRGIYNGLNDASLAHLVADVRTLQKERRRRSEAVK